MKQNKTIKRSNAYKILVGLILAFCILGSVFAVTYAYLTGAFEKDLSSDNPYLQVDWYYNNTQISSNSVTGTISADGVVNVSIDGQAITNNTTTNSTINLPITIKNSGNIDGQILSIMVVIELYENDGTTKINNPSLSNGNNSYHLQLNAVDGLNIIANSFYELENNILLTKNSQNEQQILQSISVSDSNVLKTTQLADKKFKIIFSAEILQV